MNENVTDNELVLLAQVGNDKALELLVKRYLSPVYGASLRFLGNGDDAEDATQETFVKVWRYIKNVDLQKNFRAWVMEIAKNTCLDIIKKKRTVPMSAFEDENGDNFILDTTVSTLESPIEATERSLASRLLNAAMEKLSPAYQLVLSLYYRDGLNFREISEKTNEPLHTIKSRHRRAVINLRQILGKIH